MRTLKFYGASDDLFEIDGTKGDEPSEIGCFDRAAMVKVENDSAGLHVLAVYPMTGLPMNVPGCWTIGICPLDEDIPLPGWPMRWYAEGYTTVLEIDVPDDVRVSEVQ